MIIRKGLSLLEAFLGRRARVAFSGGAGGEGLYVREARNLGYFSARTVDDFDFQLDYSSLFLRQTMSVLNDDNKAAEDYTRYITLVETKRASQAKIRRVGRSLEVLYGSCPRLDMVCLAALWVCNDSR